MRVVRILTRPNVGGPMLQAVELWHALRAEGVRTLLVIGQCAADERAVDLAATGIPRLAAAELTRDSEGLVQLPTLGNGWPWLGDRRALRELTALLRAVQPDVVHTHTSKAGWLGRRAARAAGGAVVAHTFHGHVLRDYFGPLRSRLLARLERRLAEATDVLFAVSGSCADELTELGVAARERFVVVPPAVAERPPGDRAAARRALGVADGDWLATCVGRLVPIKRVGDFAAAVQALPGLHGHVYGDGPERYALAALAAREPRLHLHATTPQVRDLLPAFDALVLPSIREGCPLVAVEAFEAGVPVVGYDVPGVRDAIVTWGGGVLVPAAAGPAGLAAALQRLRDEPALRADCIARGRAGRARFVPAAVAASLLTAYRAAVDARRGYDPAPRG